MRRSLATPCPTGPAQCLYNEDTLDDLATTNIEFTTAFQASFKMVKPRRPQVARHRATNFVIHEDEESQAPHEETLQQNVKKGFLKPAKRAQGSLRTSRAASTADDIPIFNAKPNCLQNGKPQRPVFAPRQCAARQLIIAQPIEEDGQGVKPAMEPKVERPARRKTLYVPSDDTTQPTMWMGIFSPIKNHPAPESREVEDQQMELTGIAARMAEKTRRRTSVAGVRPKRVPLQPTTTAQEKVVAAGDRMGALTGKENVPPNQPQRAPEKKIEAVEEASREKPTMRDRDNQRRTFLTQARLEHLSRPKSRDSSAVTTMYEIGTKPQSPQPSRLRKTAARVTVPQVASSGENPLTRKSIKRDSINSSPCNFDAPPKLPSKFVKPVLRTSTPLYEQIPISEHIECPELYEDDWLAHQETVTKQLLNDLFDQTQIAKDTDQGKETLRKSLLELYNTPEIKSIRNRLQAALQYGSLSLSHEAMMHLQALASDVGRKKEYLKFWLDNFDHDLLQVVLEVVTGKIVSVPPTQQVAGPSPGGTGKRRAIAKFMEAFFLRHEDAQFKAAGTGVTTDLGTKTILKSLMLLKALDTYTESSVATYSTRLFRGTAEHKSSQKALQTLMGMLNPCVGDPKRNLRQLGYQVSYEQQMLDEVHYHVENLAVDLRDGVLLTRLVELLLFRPASVSLEREVCTATCTIITPDGETVTTGQHDTYPLSQHLRIPCLSRATKLWNVQIALAALNNVKSVSKAFQDIRPEDVVDGHREKTITLLWTLVSQYGLMHLVDLTDIRQEITRLTRSRSAYDHDSDLFDRSDASQVECESLLKLWASSCASARGQVVRNFSTSFADGQVFKAILDEYEPYLTNEPEASKLSLSQRLQRLGCSNQFSNIFALGKSQVHIFSKDFVIAALAFLYSRVVRPSKLCRKVVVIQRCWRKHWKAVQAKRRAVQKELAMACVASVNLKLRSHGNTDLASPVQTSVVDEKTESEDDIWLSL